MGALTWGGSMAISNVSKALPLGRGHEMLTDRVPTYSTYSSATELGSTQQIKHVHMDEMGSLNTKYMYMPLKISNNHIINKVINFAFNLMIPVTFFRVFVYSLISINI